MPDYRTNGWIDADVPGTVLGSQVAAGVFRDPFFGMNLRKIPGEDYPIGKIFGYLPMSDKSPYHCAWWYRTEFAFPAGDGKTTWLHFDGINYRANIWLNGKQIATSDEVAGAFRAYDFDASSYLARGPEECIGGGGLRSRLENDLGIDFLDWNPEPADKTLGLWREVSLDTTGPVTMRNPSVSTHFLHDDLSEAELRVVADVANHAEHPVSVSVTAAIGPRSRQQQITLAAKEARIVSFDETVLSSSGLRILWFGGPSSMASLVSSG